MACVAVRMMRWVGGWDVYSVVSWYLWAQCYIDTVVASITILIYLIMIIII